MHNFGLIGKALVPLRKQVNGDRAVLRLIFDPLNQLDELRSLFRLRTSYAREIAQARDLGWLLDRHGGALNAHMVVRRMVWCARTITIAQLAEHDRPAFAPTELAAAAPLSADILVNRHQRRLDAAMRQRFRQYLMQEGGSPALPREATLEDYRALFVRTGNKVGLQTIERGIQPPEGDNAFYQ